MRTEDGYIVNKCLEGDPASFGLLVDKYKAGIYALAYSRLGNFHDAEDVTQEVFIKAYQKLRTLRRWDNFLAWLHAITLNLCKDWIRARSRRPDREFIADQDPRALRSLSIDSYREDQLGEVLHEALDSLPESYRQALTLYYLGGMNSVEIARFLGTSPTAIRQRLSRARSQLKEGMLAMMSQTFEGQRLQVGFTFRIVEAVKRVKIQPMPRMTGLPWGLSVAAGIVLTVMSLSPHLSISNRMIAPTGSPLPSETKVLKTGEIPVDILKISQIPAISSKQENGDNGVANRSDPKNTFFMAPQGEGDTWTEKSDMPTARWGLSTSVVNGRIYAIGGVNPETLEKGLPTVEEYDPSIDKWTKKADMPTARQFLSTSVVGGKIYAIGGYAGGPIERSTVEEYDPGTGKWTKKANIPTPRMFFSTSVVNGRIYAIGGWKQGAVISAVEEYDPVADKWKKKDDMPDAIRGLSTGVVNRKIYAIGGYDRNDVALSTVREYNPVLDRWVKKADMPTSRMGLSTSVVNGKIYAIGGVNRSNRFSAVEEYDPVTDKWVKKADMPTARFWLSTSAMNGKIYAIGGMGADANVALSTVEEYDTGFAVESVEADGKLPTTWGEEKRRGDRATR